MLNFIQDIFHKVSVVVATSAVAVVGLFSPIQKIEPTTNLEISVIDQAPSDIKIENTENNIALKESVTIIPSKSLNQISSQSIEISKLKAEINLLKEKQVQLELLNKQQAEIVKAEELAKIITEVKLKEEQETQKLVVAANSSVDYFVAEITTDKTYVTDRYDSILLTITTKSSSGKILSNKRVKMNYSFPEGFGGGSFTSDSNGIITHKIIPNVSCNSNGLIDVIVSDGYKIYNKIIPIISVDCPRS